MNEEVNANNNNENHGESDLQLRVRLAGLEAAAAGDRRRSLEIEESNRREAEHSQQEMFKATLEAELMRGGYTLATNLDLGKFTRICEVHGTEFTSDKAGRVINAQRNGTELPIGQAFRELFSAHPELLDGRCAGARELVWSDERIKSKEDLRHHPDAMREYIEARGLESFERLPQHPIPESPKGLTADQWRALPLAVKSKFIAQIGVAGLEEILKKN